MTRVLVVSDVRLYRDAVAEVLERRGEFEVTAIAGGIDQTLAAVLAVRPGFLLLDVLVPEALAIARAIASEDGTVDVIALTVPDAESEILACAEAGVSGYVSREGTVDDLIGAIQAAMRGEFDCPASVAKSFARRLAALATDGNVRPAGPPSCALGSLTPREFEIAALIDRGLSNKDIARTLGVQLSTVKNHVHSILSKLNVHRRGEAAAQLRPFFLLDATPSGAVSTPRR